MVSGVIYTRFLFSRRSLDPGIVKDVPTLPSFVICAVVEPEVVGQFSVWFSSEHSERLRGGFAMAAWDVGEFGRIWRHGQRNWIGEEQAFVWGDRAGKRCVSKFVSRNMNAVYEGKSAKKQII
tara:strand:+ start:483 stop:851 length:369 start_codon:yes stop_codon:yes gene_type:complete